MNFSDMKPAQGALLISEPFLRDFYFRRSVILLAEHNESGSFGLILNKPIDIKINEIVKDFPSFDANLFIGGPVGTDSLFVLHTLGNKISKSSKISQGLYWGGDIQMIREMIAAKAISPGEIRFYIGYSGWGAKQLDKELDQKSWLVTKAKAGVMLEDPAENL